MDNYALLIDAHGFSAWRHTGQGLECVLRLDGGNNEEATAKLQSWLALARGRCTPLVDFADERHIVERLPRAARADRRLLIARRLAQRFPESALTSATVLPSSPEDGLLTPVRLAALSRSALSAVAVAPWLDALGEAATRGRIELRALTSVPFLFEHWYRRQRSLPEQALILAPGAGGLRQLFFRHRRLVFSRAVPASAASLAECLPAYREELAQTLAWLTSQRLCDKPPPVRALATAEDFPLLRELAPFAGADFDCIALAAHPGADGSADIRALSLRETCRRGGFGFGLEPGHYAHPALARPRRLAITRRAMIAATLAVSAVALAGAASDFTAINTIKTETARLAARQHALQIERNTLRVEAEHAPQFSTPVSAQFAAQFAKSPTAPTAMSAWLDEAERLAHAPGIASADVLQAVADLLAETPWARLESLGWHRAQDGDESVTATSAAAEPSAAATIDLEISLASNAPSPRVAAETLSARWRRLHGVPMRTNIDSGLARLRFNATLALSPAKETPGKNAP